MSSKSSLNRQKWTPFTHSSFPPFFYVFMNGSKWKDTIPPFFEGFSSQVCNNGVTEAGDRKHISWAKGVLHPRTSVLHLIQIDSLSLQEGQSVSPIVGQHRTHRRLVFQAQQ